MRMSASGDVLYLHIYIYPSICEYRNDTYNWLILGSSFDNKGNIILHILKQLSTAKSEFWTSRYGRLISG